ncbi:MAG: twin transmembrane helix small protein [Alphaproteobacteria bacterium]|nr:twin transmembrane helix small protein [Alphaproteobacteria bacterium]MCW5743652.1 twin transmembrane helix small protein [Alphaproteobacteria bacterium]
MKVLSYLFLILAGLSMLGALGSIFIGMAGMSAGGLERAQRSNRFMWWRVRLQLAAIVFIILWYFTSRAG